MHLAIVAQYELKRPEVCNWLWNACACFATAQVLAAVDEALIAEMAATRVTRYVQDSHVVDNTGIQKRQDACDMLSLPTIVP